MPTSFAVQPLDATFGAVITGVTLATIDEATSAELHKTWLKYALLVFPGQHLKHDEQIAFAKHFGPLEFEMAALSNVKADGTLRLEKDNDDRMKVLKGNMGWHMDFDLHAGPGKGRRVLGRGSADDRRPHRLLRHARGLRRARRGDP